MVTDLTLSKVSVNKNSNYRRRKVHKFNPQKRDEHRLRLFENRVLNRIFAPKREEDGSWRRLHNDEIHSLYSSPNNVRVIK
jgi:hypothetical protein